MPKLALQRLLTYPVFVDLNPALQYQKRVEVVVQLLVLEVVDAIALTKQPVMAAVAVVGLLVKGKVEDNFNDTWGDRFRIQIEKRTLNLLSEEQNR
jgi:hypothetical protein